MNIILIQVETQLDKDIIKNVDHMDGYSIIFLCKKTFEKIYNFTLQDHRYWLPCFKGFKHLIVGEDFFSNFLQYNVKTMDF